MKYDVIIFDLGNVVVMFDHNISARKFAKKFGLDHNKIYNLFFDSRITRLHDTGKLSPAEFYRKARKILGADIGFGEFKKYWNNIFFPNRNMRALIKKLKRKHAVYLMSNTNKLHFEFIKKNFKVINEFDKIILSYKIGKLKPHPKIYKHALRLARTTPDKVLYIDDREDLVRGARSLGIDSIQFHNLPKLKRDLNNLT